MIDIGGCILSIVGAIGVLDPRDYDSAWQWWIEHLFAAGWDGRSTI